MAERDVVVVGGGVAGLQCALTLGRARRRVVLVDDGNPRNRSAARVHNFLAVPDASPAALLDTARGQAVRYGVEITDDRVETVVPVPGPDPAFTVRARGGARWTARAVVLATGLRDELPDVPGLAELWGGRVVACPHCHGWEVAGEPLAQLGRRGDPARGVARALLLSRWSDRVVLCTDGDRLVDGDRDRLARAGVAVHTERVERVEPLTSTTGVRIRFVGDAVLDRRALFTVVRQHQRTDLAVRLGARLLDAGPHAGGVATDETGRCGPPGVWAAGTTAVPPLLAVAAAGHAATVAVAVHADLLDRDLSPAPPFGAGPT